MFNRNPGRGLYRNAPSVRNKQQYTVAVKKSAQMYHARSLKVILYRAFRTRRDAKPVWYYIATVLYKVSYNTSKL